MDKELADLIADYCRAASYGVNPDHTAPSIVFSYLPEAKEWYASIVRYRRPFARGKVVVWSLRSKWRDMVLDGLILALDKGPDNVIVGQEQGD